MEYENEKENNEGKWDEDEKNVWIVWIMRSQRENSWKMRIKKEKWENKGKYKMANEKNGWKIRKVERKLIKKIKKN